MVNKRAAGTAKAGKNIIRLLEKELKACDSSLKLAPVSPSIFVFEERVKLMCFHCTKYNNCFTCPPKIPKLNYKKIINEYKNCAVVYCNMNFSEENYDEIRSASTNLIHRTILRLEKVLRDHNNPMVLSFIGGSCKLCKGGCPPDRCKNPYLARIPVEAIGINLVKSLGKIGVEIKFPVINNIYRYGLILW